MLITSISNYLPKYQTLSEMVDVPDAITSKVAPYFNSFLTQVHIIFIGIQELPYYLPLVNCEISITIHESLPSLPGFDISILIENLPCV